MIKIEPRPITLGGKEWTIPAIPWKPFSKIRAPIYALRDAITDPKTNVLSPERYTRLSPEQIAEMADVVFTAITCADPNFTQEEFDQLPIADFELRDAFLIVGLQTGQYVLFSSEQGTSPPGEAAADGTTSISTA
jgi:hypothetical protein